jgi:SAM-dependent methyltransferase
MIVNIQFISYYATRDKWIRKVTRNKKILEAIKPSSQLGIEIGPLANPIVTKDMGDIAYIDRMNFDEICKYYQNNPDIDNEKIVSIDYVCGESILEEAVGTDKKFDYVIASHVIEHVPDMIAWFKEISNILKPHGILSLVIPDKRYTFDRLRRTTSGADLIDAYFCQLKKPSTRQIFDHFLLVAEVDAQKIWSGECDDRQLKKYTTALDGFNACKDSIDNDNYIDSHCWVFTPYSFFENLKLLIGLGLFDFEMIKYFDTAVGEIEFFVSAPSAAWCFL